MTWLTAVGLSGCSGLPGPSKLWHTVTHGKQRQRSQRSQESSEAQTETRADQARDLHTAASEVGKAAVPAVFRDKKPSAQLRVQTADKVSN